MIITKNFKLVSAHKNGLVATIFVGVNDSSANSRVVVESIITESCYIVHELGFDPKSKYLKNNQYIEINNKLIDYLESCLSNQVGIKNFSINSLMTTNHRQHGDVFEE
jgi:hypothetical protein